MLGYVLGQVDISQPIDISATVATYSPAPTIDTPPTLVPAASIPPDVQAVLNAQQQAQYAQAQAAAFRQGFAPAATFGQWLQTHSSEVYLGFGFLALSVFMSQRR